MGDLMELITFQLYINNSSPEIENMEQIQSYWSQFFTKRSRLCTRKLWVA